MATDVVDPTAEVQGALLDEHGNPLGEEIATNITEEMMESMKKIWMVFDHEEKDSVTIVELATIMRALDVNVDREEKLDEIRAAIDPNNTKVFNFSSLKDVMEEQLKDHDTIEAFIEQIKKLDKDGDGKIPTPEFKQYMTNMAKMMDEELDDLMKVADPKGEGFVDIMDLAESICPPKPPKN